MEPSKVRHTLHLGPFEVIKAKGKNTFALRLPSNWRIHNASHVSKLRLAIENDEKHFPFRKANITSSPMIDEEGENVREVEKIVDHRKRRNRLEYRVRWLDSDQKKIHGKQQVLLRMPVNRSDVSQLFILLKNPTCVFVK